MPSWRVREPGDDESVADRRGGSTLPLKDTHGPRERIRVADWAYGRLRDAIHSGELISGEWLNVPGLAQELGVSRSPVREAVQRLVREGLAVEEPHRGAVVADIRWPQLRLIYEVREALEGMAARAAAERMSDEQLRELRAQLDRHWEVVQAGDPDRHIDLDQEFHAQIRQATENPWLIDYLDRLRSLVRLAMRSTIVTGGPAEALKDHARIVEALESRDPQLAEDAARAHIARLHTALARANDAEA